MKITLTMSKSRSLTRQRQRQINEQTRPGTAHRRSTEISPNQRSSSQNNVTLQAVYELLLSVQNTVTATQDEVSNLRREISEIKGDCEALGGAVDTIDMNLGVAENKIDIIQQNLFENDIEISGVPEQSDETQDTIMEHVIQIAEALDVEVSENDINDIFRLKNKSNSGQPGKIICSFVRKIKRNTIMANRKKKTLKTDILNLGQNTKTERIYVSERLTNYNRFLLTKTKEAARNGLTERVYVHYGVVHHKPKADSKPIIVDRKYFCTSDLYKQPPATQNGS